MKLEYDNPSSLSLTESSSDLRWQTLSPLGLLHHLPSIMCNIPCLFCQPPSQNRCTGLGSWLQKGRSGHVPMYSQMSPSAYVATNAFQPGHSIFQASFSDDTISRSRIYVKESAPATFHDWCSSPTKLCVRFIKVSWILEYLRSRRYRHPEMRYPLESQISRQITGTVFGPARLFSILDTTPTVLITGWVRMWNTTSDKLFSSLTMGPQYLSLHSQQLESVRPLLPD